MEMLQHKLSLLPDTPGVYLMKDASGKVIYVGKAKILKNRVRSYFTGSHDGKTQVLVSQITDFEYILTGTEAEALVLECNLIKKYDPKYNILLRDDKTYPYIIITDEVHPRILVTRQVKKKSGKHFGPYPNVRAAREAARLLNQLFPFRKCHQIPTRPCLYYSLGQCLGPCVEEVPAQSYDEMKKAVSAFLRGDQEKIIQTLTEKMAQAADDLQFERAKEYRDLIEDLKRLSEKQSISLNDFVDRDVVAYAVTTDQMCVQIFYLRQGKLLARDNFVFPYYEETEEAFISFLVQFYTNQSAWPKEILLPPTDISALGKLLPVNVPQRGQKRELIQLAITNAQTALHEQVAIEAREHGELENALSTLSDSLNIPTPSLIEAFDISNTAGTEIVAGMVMFRNGRPDRQGYRKFKIQPMETTDDTASLRQTIQRRYTRSLSEGLSLPNLILVDGGKGQIRSAKDALNALDLDVPVAGMVKNAYHQTAGLLDSMGNLVPLDTHSAAFHLLERIQNEVHRFAITFHRQRRAKNMTLSALDGIRGIGPRRRQQLLGYFKSLEKISDATIQELIKSGLPANLASEVYSHFQQTRREKEDTDDSQLSGGTLPPMLL